MKLIKKILTVITIVAVFHLKTAQAQENPSSLKEMLSKVEEVFNKHDSNMLDKLYCWDGVTPKMKTQFQGTFKYFLGGTNTNVTVSSVSKPNDFAQEFTGPGAIQFKFNLPVDGLILVRATNGVGKGSSSAEIKLPYGQKDGRYYIPAPVQKDPNAVPVKQKSISIMAMAVDSPLPHVEGYYVIVNGTNETKETFKSDNGNMNKAFWAGDLKYCQVQSSSTNGSISLTIMEDGKEIFNEEKTDYTGPIIYQKQGNQNNAE